MASYTPPEKGVAWRGYITLFDSDGAIVTNPTLAAGDFIVSTDGGATSNLDTTPSVVPVGGDAVQIDLSIAEMSGDNVWVRGEDQAGDEWMPVALLLQPVASGQQFDDLATTGADSDTLETLSDQLDNVAPQVWEEALADHSGTVGSTAEALNAAGSAGDPWNTALPGAYAAGKAGYILGTTVTGALTNLVNRLGAFTGSGVNTVLGFLQAIMRKDVTTPTDAGGTYDDATDSLEALRDKVDTLPSTTAQASAASESGAIAAVAYATLSETVSGLSIPADWTKCIFTVKADLDDADSAALIQIVESNPGVAADGLLYLNGDDPTEESLTAADGSLTVDQSAQTVAIYLTDEAMAVLGFFGGFYDIKTVDADGDTLRQDYGTLDVSETATRATS